MDLCGKPFSAADYLEITKRFGSVFLLDIPKMGMDRKDLVSFLGINKSLGAEFPCRLGGLLLS